MDIIQAIKKDHKETTELFEKVMNAKTAKAREREFGELRKELVPHIKAEESMFFPLLEKGKHKSDILEAYEEHHASELLLRELKKTGMDNERWPAKLKVLKEIVDHHTEEEESKILKAAQSELDKQELKDLAEKFQAEKEKIRTKLKS